MVWLRTWAALALVFAAVVISVRVLAFGSVVLDGPTITAMIAVPIAQVGLLALVRRIRNRP
jgi:hypothetical protein